MNTSTKRRIKAVEYYLNSKKSLRKTAKKFRISHLTLWRWVQWYKQGGKESLNREDFFRPWNRLDIDLEKEIALLKEGNPSLTIKDARILLSRKDISISTNGIWSIWKRYGLVSSPKRARGLDLANQFFQYTDAISSEVVEAKKLLASFGTIPFSDYYKKAHRLRKRLEKDRLFYSAVRIGVTEAITLSWRAKPEKQIALVQHLKRWIPRHGDLYLKFLVLIGEGIAHAQKLDIEHALNCAKMCRDVLKHLKNVPSLWRELGNLYEHIGRYPEAHRIIEKILDGRYGDFDEVEGEVYNSDRALLLATAGNHHACLETLRKIDKKRREFRGLTAILRAQCMLDQARIYDAQESARRALEQARKDEIPGLLHVASLIFASSAAAMGEQEKARHAICRLNPIFKKSKMEKDVFVRKMLCLSRNVRLDSVKASGRVLAHSVCRLTFLLAKASRTLALKDYRYSYGYAARHRILGLFNRFSLFYPEIVTSIVAKRKSPGLSKAFVRLPVFNKDVPVYRISFLGPLHLYRQKRIQFSIPTKDHAFLIYLALSRMKSMQLDEIYNAFWPKSTMPSRNLSHILVRVRRALQLPAHYFRMQANRLICTCQFVTDYDDFENCIAQAKALERIGDWYRAEQEYCSAFSLFRSRPFAKMYDDFSEKKRLEIIFRFEDTARHFVEELSKNLPGNSKGALSPAVKKVLRRIRLIAPDVAIPFLERSSRRE
ncbi:hypothetical protein AMJ83_11300 [candidate division WOR_3 bacterium SM23_42]|uniref:Insertion element IS150 protein InsJ-like helix-turn-helix domain-containing protein n=1 Tax=candidate division WOR_3 bacterium SM23_42 TaxID=1703779 RepID=A0A0S8FRU7_UNCW3|nr:MAG: hypothetical protein AMJ83_11300 [candidate division WOR_3 bacterium SM23_42]